MIHTEPLHANNLRLSQLEYEQHHVFLQSRPRCLGLVLGNACNIDCPHCYQAKTGANLLHPAEIGDALRRELMAFYPYLSTLRLQGGEAFALRGFRELIDDVAALVDRPILSVATNGTLIDEAWAERLVRIPFADLTVSIDGGTRDTYNRLRRGADLDLVLANIDRIQRWKARLGSERPYLNSFFVIMRSNFREIPQYLELMHRHGMIEVALQTMEVNRENTARHPTLEADEAVSGRSEVTDLHAILREVLPQYQPLFRTVRISGLQTLFEAHGLSAAFLEEGEKSLYPASDGLAEGAFELCPNPWTTLFIAENGDVHLCFISQPIGNLYAEPLAAIWNSPMAVAKRTDMLAGRYLASGCSSRYCSWREGKTPRAASARREEWTELVQLQPPLQSEFESPGTLMLLRRLMAEERRKRIELEAQQSLFDARQQHAQQHIDHLEAKTEKAVADFYRLQAEYAEYCSPWLVRAADALSRALPSFAACKDMFAKKNPV